MGDGPMDGCVVLQRANYSELKEVTHAEDGAARR
jgi:hypothetical protein